MIDFLKRLFGGAAAPPPPPRPRASDKPPLPAELLAEFEAWYLTQHKPAVALRPDPAGAIGSTGSRLGGPVWLAAGEAWPVDEKGVPLEFIAQLDLADCSALAGYPRSGLVQFFIGRDDLYGAEFDDLLAGSYLVRYCAADAAGALHAPPPLTEHDGVPCSDYSPFQNDGVRENGLALAAVLVDDPIDLSIKEAELRIDELYKHYDIATLYAFAERPEVERPIRHHTGGYPAFTQSDIRNDAAYADLDQVLLRLTSDDSIMWGDVGEAVFMMRSEDLATGDFSKVAFSWDCH
ncbi:MAG TPA: YwqG family protein [Croceibacterium sp.]